MTTHSTIMKEIMPLMPSDKSCNVLVICTMNCEYTKALSEMPIPVPTSMDTPYALNQLYFVYRANNSMPNPMGTR